MTAQRQKHPDRLADKRLSRYRPAPVTRWNGPAPRLSADIQGEARRVWRELWRSPLAGAFQPTDIAALRRWAWWLYQWERASHDVAREPITIEGTHTPVLNPKARYLRQCETALRELEKAFGMDALARLRLGITLADGQSKAAALRQPAAPRAM